jgi:hypothetical protein
MWDDCSVLINSLISGLGIGGWFKTSLLVVDCRGIEFGIPASAINLLYADLGRVGKLSG